MESKYTLCLHDEIYWMEFSFYVFNSFVCEMLSLHKNTLSLAVCQIRGKIGVKLKHL